MIEKTYTIKNHLFGKDMIIVDLYERFAKLVEACGPFEYVISKDGIAFKGQRRNFAVAKPKNHWLDGVLILQRPLEDSRIRVSQRYTKRLFGNQFRVTKPDQLDDEFTSWIREAYQVGEGLHLVD
jgi:Domain of unknown function (DUF5655)